MNPEKAMEQPLDKAEAGQMEVPICVDRVVQDEPESAQTNPSGSSRPRFWLYLGLGVVAAGIVAAAVTIPVVLLNDDDDNEPNAQAAQFEPLFNENLPLLSNQVLEGYSSTEEFQGDLWKFAESYVNGVVGRNYGDKSYANFGGPSDVLVRGGAVPTAAQETAKSPDAPSNAAPESDPSGAFASDVNDYETNNQEKGVLEGDNVLTDGNIAVAAYGNYIVGWNVTDGTKLFKMEMEPTNDGYGGRAYINTMLLNQGRLFVVANGYGFAAQTSEQRVLSDYLGTRVLVYDLDSIGQNKDKLDLLAQRDVNGYFVSIRGIGNTVHLILRNQLNTYPFFVAPYDRYNNPAMGKMNLDAYAAEVYNLSTNKSIPEFVNQTILEIMECGALPQLVRLNRWTTDNQSDSTMEHYLYDGGYAKSMMTIASFDLDAIVVNGTEAFTCVPMAGAFFPADSWNVQVYSATDTMIMAVGGYDYSTTRNMSIDSTYIVAFGLNGASATPKALGSAEGSVLNQYSFRVDGAILEFATTIREMFMWRMIGAPMMATEAAGGGRNLQATIDPVPEIVTIPTVENYVITADLEAGDGQIKELDRIQLGKEGESFTAVRFYKNRAYAVTFRRVDPFYVLNMEDPKNISIAGMLDNITGWSSYLEPMNDDNTVMLAIGQEADEWGGALGVSISVFDARNLTNVTLSARYLIESNSSVWSDSEGLQEKNAIRFNAETGLLILPLSLYGDQYFRGFRVFIATVDSVVSNCTVDLSEDYSPYYYSYESLEPRAMIINGSAMTTMESDVTMTNLASCTQEWNLKWN